MRALVHRECTVHCLVGWLMSAACSNKESAFDLSILEKYYHGNNEDRVGSHLWHTPPSPYRVRQPQTHLPTHHRLVILALWPSRSHSTTQIPIVKISFPLQFSSRQEKGRVPSKPLGNLGESSAVSHFSPALFSSPLCMSEMATKHNG